MAKILVTGATGFLGGYLVRRLEADGKQVIASGRNEEKGKEFSNFARCDLSNTDEVQDLFTQNPDIELVINSAALSSAWGKYEDFYKANYVSVENTLNAISASDNNIKLIHVSSPSVYARMADQNMLTEDEPFPEKPMTPYSKTKQMAERLLEKRANFPYAIIRPRGIIGVGDTSVVPRLLNASTSPVGIPLVGGGIHSLDVTCVENVVEAIIAVMKIDMKGQIFHVTDGNPRPFRELLGILESGLGTEFKKINIPRGLLNPVAHIMQGLYKTFSPGTEPRLTPYTLSTIAYEQTLSIDKLLKETDYKPLVSLESELDRYAKYYKSYLA